VKDDNVLDIGAQTKRSECMKINKIVKVISEARIAMLILLSTVMTWKGPVVYCLSDFSWMEGAKFVK